MLENMKEIKGMFLITDGELEQFLAFCEKRITDAVKDFCNIEEIPERLNSLIQEFLIEQYTLNKEGIGNGKKEVSSASDNGQSVNFKTIGGAETMAKNVSEFIKRNHKTLIPYRKLRW